MKKLSILLILFVACFFLIAAKQNETENKDGVAYGSAVQRDTDYVEWNNITYIDLENSRLGINFVFKVLTAAADTVILNTLGANSDPSELTSFYTIRADTVILPASDSMVVLNLPYGTTVTTSVLPRYLKIQVITADTTDGSGATATIGDSYIWR